jgi:hypothetical protein
MRQPHQQVRRFAPGMGVTDRPPLHRRPLAAARMVNAGHPLIHSHGGFAGRLALGVLHSLRIAARIHVQKERPTTFVQATFATATTAPP